MILQFSWEIKLGRSDSWRDFSFNTLQIQSDCITQLLHCIFIRVSIKITHGVLKPLNHASITTGTKLPLTMWWSLHLLYRQVKWGMKRLVILPEGFCLSPWHVVSNFSHLVVVPTCDFSSRLRDPRHKNHVANKHPNQLTHRIPMLAHIFLAPSQPPLPYPSQDKAVALAHVITKPFLHPAKFTIGLSGQPPTKQLLQNRELKFPMSTSTGLLRLNMNFTDMNYTTAALCMDVPKPKGPQASEGQCNTSLCTWSPSLAPPKWLVFARPINTTRELIPPLLSSKKRNSSLPAFLGYFISGCGEKQSHWGEVLGNSTQDQERAASVAVRAYKCQI